MNEPGDDDMLELTVNQGPSECIELAVGPRKIRLICPGPQPESDERISFWWGVTSSALALSRYIESDIALDGKKVLELGSGVGLAGLAAALNGAIVTFSDYVPQALETAKLNAIANHIPHERTDFQIIDWENPGSIGYFDVIIGSEIVYEYFFHSALSDLILNCLKHDGVLILADRERLVVERFVGRMRKKGFSCIKNSCPVNEDGFPHQLVTMYLLKRI